MEQKLQNDDLIRQLCAVHDQTLLQQHQDSSNNGQSQTGELVTVDIVSLKYNTNIATQTPGQLKQ